MSRVSVSDDDEEEEEGEEEEAEEAEEAEGFNWRNGTLDSPLNMLTAIYIGGRRQTAEVISRCQQKWPQQFLQSPVKEEGGPGWKEVDKGGG